MATAEHRLWAGLSVVEVKNRRAHGDKGLCAAKKSEIVGAASMPENAGSCRGTDTLPSRIITQRHCMAMRHESCREGFMTAISV